MVLFALCTKMLEDGKTVEIHIEECVPCVLRIGFISMAIYFL